MIALLEASNFRMLRSNRVALQPFQVLVGKNATGKSTFLGALDFLTQLLRDGVRAAVDSTASSFLDICFQPGEPIGLAVELTVGNGSGSERRLRYEIEIGLDPEAGLRVQRENLFLLPVAGAAQPLETSLFPDFVPAIPVIPIHDRVPRGWRRVVSKTKEGRDYFKDERTDWNNMFRFGTDKPALGSLPEDPERFPLSIAARNALRNGIRPLALNTREMRSSSPPGAPVKLALDGSNLPHAVRAFKNRDPVLAEQWVQHVAAAVDGLAAIDVRERQDDRHLVLEAKFHGSHPEPVPSWMLSDGTLRLMALTLVNYAAAGESETYLIEEPENGLHPLAIQVAFDALAGPAQNAQVLCATHSPIFLAQVELDDVLVFRRAPGGHAIVRRGTEVPELKEWTDHSSISNFFVTGVLA